MKKIVFTLLFLFSISFVFSQKGFHKIGIGANMGIPQGDFKENYETGYGAYLKALFGVGKESDITFTTGYISFKLIPNIYYKSGSVAIIPIFAGYRHTFSGLYVEPQFGVNLYRMDFTGVGGTPKKDNQPGFGLGMGIGYTIMNIDLGARYETGQSDDKNFSFFGFRLGYNFPITKH